MSRYFILCQLAVTCLASTEDSLATSPLEDECYPEMDASALDRPGTPTLHKHFSPQLGAVLVESDSTSRFGAPNQSKKPVSRRITKYRACKITDCGKCCFDHFRRFRLCRAHGLELLPEEELEKVRCTFPGCTTFAQTRGDMTKCRHHGGGFHCALPGCEAPVKTRGDLCGSHKLPDDSRARSVFQKLPRCSTSGFHRRSRGEGKNCSVEDNVSPGSLSSRLEDLGSLTI